MKLALSDNKMDKAREHYKNAQAINPDFQGLRWPGWLIWMHGEGRFFVVIVLIVVLILLIKLIRPVFAWYESTYWTRIRVLSAIFPSLALRSLEKCFGYVSGNYERRQLFGLLVKCCEKSGKSSKGLQYAENLLEISPGDEIAVNMIGRHLIRQPEISPDKMPLLLSFAINSKDNAKVIEKTGSFIKRSNQVKPEHLDFLKLYVQKFPEDKDMFALIGKSLLEIPASELPDSAVSMLETAWKATDSDELWWNLWRALMVNGKFELALHITEEALSRGKPVSADKLLEVFDREQMAEAQTQIDLLNSFDQKVTINAAKSLLMVKYVCQEAGQALLQTLDRLLHEENPDLSGAARQAYDFIKARIQSTENARAKLLSVSSAPAIDRARLSDDQLAAKESFENSEEELGQPEDLPGSSDVASAESFEADPSPESLDSLPEQDEGFGIFDSLIDQENVSGDEAYAEQEKQEDSRDYQNQASRGEIVEDVASHNKAGFAERQELKPENMPAQDAIEAFEEDSQEQFQPSQGDGDADEYSLPSFGNKESDYSGSGPEYTDFEEGKADFNSQISEEENDDVEDGFISDEDLEDDDFGGDEPVDDEEDEEDGEDEEDDEDDEDEYEGGEDRTGFFDEEDFSDESADDDESESDEKMPKSTDELPVVGAAEELDDYSDYIVGVPQDVPVGSEAGSGVVSEEEVPEDYSDFILGVDDDKIENTDRPATSGTFDEIPEYTLTEVSPDEIKDVLEGRGLVEEVAKRRKELFASLEEVEPEPEISDDWREYLKNKPDCRIFEKLDE
jgi:hypothetical protein